MTLGERIRNKRVAEKLTAFQLGEKLGGISKDKIYKWEEDKGQPKNEERQIVLDWLGSEGSQNSNTELDIIPLPFLDKRRIAKSSSNPYLVPFIDLSAQAGYRSAYSDVDYIHTLKHYPILPDVDPTGATWRYFQVAGDSMEPVLNDGDTVLTSLVIQDDWDNVRDYYTHVIVTHTELLIKDLFKHSDKEWILLSQNPHYEPRLLKIEDVRQLFVVRRRVQNKLPKNRIYNISDIKKQLKSK